MRVPSRPVSSRWILGRAVKPQQSLGFGSLHLGSLHIFVGGSDLGSLHALQASRPGLGSLRALQVGLVSMLGMVATRCRRRVKLTTDGVLVDRRHTVQSIAQPLRFWRSGGLEAGLFKAC
jgi:hypothetical protein